jgi:diguanylate cyclase (GGDEF)-like protein
MFVDVDDLKRVNDEYGHDVGDALIVGAARVLTQTFRTGDLVSRLGGDEFAVLALLSTGDSTATFTNRLAFHLDAFNNDTKLRMILQMSLGTREFEWTDNIGLESLVAQADAHMYEQKRKKKRPSY